MISNFLKSKNLKNSYWIIGEQIFQMALSLVVGLLTARYLGPSNYGTLSYTASFISFFTAISGLSMEGVMVMKLVAHPNEEDVYLGSAIGYRFVSAILSSIAIGGLIVVLNPGDSLKLLLVSIQSGQLLCKSFEILDAWFQKRLQSKYVSIGKMLASIIVSGYKIFLLVSMKDIVWFAFSNTLSDLVIALVMYFFYKKQSHAKLKFNIKKANELLSESYHFILSDVMSACYLQLDRIMIGFFIDEANVGFYSIASIIVTLYNFIPIAVIKSFRPTIIKLFEDGNYPLYKLKLEQLISGIFWMNVFFAVVISVFGKLIVKILYGMAYIEASNPLILLCWARIFAITSMTRMIWILCEKKNKYVKNYVFIGFVVNLVLNLIVIPKFGIDGAAFTTLITEIIVCVCAPLLFKETRPITLILIRSFVLCWYFERKNKNA